MPEKMSTRGRRTPGLVAPASPSAESLAAVRAAEAAMSSIPDPEPEEVVVEPDLPVEPELTPEDLEQMQREQAEAEYQRQVSNMLPDEPRWVCGPRAKRLSVGGRILSRGEVVPGAEFWRRRESWERAGYIEREAPHAADAGS